MAKKNDKALMTSLCACQARKSDIPASMSQSSLSTYLLPGYGGRQRERKRKRERESESERKSNTYG
ncbi:hypothetical protein J6590_081529 [Homalodisca vitripennis]|nr:hypothetical protein J6590_081529 [Homalodisca vitripennis]